MTLTLPNLLAALPLSDELGMSPEPRLGGQAMDFDEHLETDEAALPTWLPDPTPASRSTVGFGFAAPVVPEGMDVWPRATSPASPPQGGQATTSSAPAGPEGPDPIGRVPEAAADVMPDAPMGPQDPEGFDAPVAQSEQTVEATLGEVVEPEVYEAPKTLQRQQPSQIRPVSWSLSVDVPSTPTVTQQPTPEPQPLPTQPEVYELLDEMQNTRQGSQDHVRVEVDGDLAVEIRAVRQGHQVVLDGTVDALEPLADAAGDFDDALRKGGSELAGFEQRRRAKAKAPKPQDRQRSEGEPETEDATPPSGGALINVVI